MTSVVPLPPFRHAWTLYPGKKLSAIEVAGDVAYAVDGEALYAIDLRQGELLWRSSLESVSDVAFADGSLFVVTSARDSKRLIQMDPTTRRRIRQWTIGSERQFAVRDGILYAYLKNGRFAAIEVASGKTLWTHRFRTNWHDDFAPKISGDYVAFGQEMHEFVVAERTTGRVRWRLTSENKSALYGCVGIFGDVVVVHDGSVMEGRSTNSGELLWSLHVAYGSRKASTLDRLVISTDDELILLDPRSGEILFRRTHALSLAARFARGLSTSDSLAWLGATFVHESLASKAYSADGKRLWRSRRLQGLKALWSDGQALVMHDACRLYGYVSGQDDPVPGHPEQRRDWLQRRVAQADFLDPRELATLERFGAEAFDVILEALHPWRASTSDYRDPERSEALQRILRDHLIPEWTPAITQVVQRLETGDRRIDRLFELLTYGCDPQMAGAFLVPYLTAIPRDGWKDHPHVKSALDALCHCPYDPGIDLLIDTLDDKDFRSDLYYKIALTGPRGAEAIVALRQRFPPKLEHWPGVSRTASTDLEKAVEAAFDACGSSKGAEPIRVYFPNGMEPFAMAGAIDGSFIVEPFPEENRPAWGVGFSFADGQGVLEEYPEGATLSIHVSRTWNEWSVSGFRIDLKKFEAGWAPISTGDYWI